MSDPLVRKGTSYIGRSEIANFQDDGSIISVNKDLKLDESYGLEHWLVSRGISGIGLAAKRIDSQVPNNNNENCLVYGETIGDMPRNKP